MKRFPHLFIWAIIAFFANIATLEAQTGNPTMDAQWTVITNDGSQLVLELGISTNTIHEHLGPAQFIFLYDPNYVKFNSGSTGPGSSGTDYNWLDSFSPAVYTGFSTGYASSSSVSQPSLGEIVINLDFQGAPGAAISLNASYTRVVDIIFSVSDHTQSTTITWAMSELIPPTMDNVYNDQLTPINFDEDNFSGIVVNPLPVTVLNFLARMNNSETILMWSTTSEINNDYFTVERSEDGLNFSPIKQVKGAGNSEIKKEYITYDESPLPGTSYYRLRQTDFNGASKIFNMVSVNNTVAEAGGINIIGISTDATIPVITYSIQDNTPVTIIVTDINGKTIYKDQTAVQKGVNKYSFSDAIKWKSGIYSIILINKNQSVSTKMLIP